MSAFSPPGSAGPSPGEGSVDGAQRRERAAIAAQACETCRARKSKCDEKRPKCGLCQRLGAECRYREPLPTKKDKTMVFMLDALQRIEGKVDQIGKVFVPNGGVFDVASHSSDQSGRPASIGGGSTDQGKPGRDVHQHAKQQIQTHPPPTAIKSPGSSNVPVHITTPHRILLWPFIRSRLEEFNVDVAGDLRALVQAGTPWVLRQDAKKHPDILPCNVSPNSEQVQDLTSPDGMPRARFPDLSYEEMRTYATHYFDTFNLLYLILDRASFMNTLLPHVARRGFGEDEEDSIIALLVLSLGKVAFEGTWSTPLENGMNFASGLKGGTKDRPPGLDFFNEARRRTGFVAYKSSVENIQILLLTAIYFESCGRHLEFWRAASAASASFQVLTKCTPIDWFTEHGSLVKRLYWTCNLIENWYHFDLDLPRTGMVESEDEIPLPGELLGQATAEEQQAMMHFLAMIALRRLVTRVHRTLFEESSEGYGGPPTHVIRELARQLESWRTMLPQPLQWSDEPPEARFHYGVPGLEKTFHSNIFSSGSSNSTVPLSQQSAMDLLVAQLRSRYYQCRFIIYRPFVFKALHFPELVTREDRMLIAMCIKSTLMWPMALAPPKNRKRLVPYPFAWTQNFLGILLILRMTTISSVLAEVCRRDIDQTEVMLTVQYMLEWIADAREIDAIASWSWTILEPLFRDAFPHIRATAV
ncbi:hypothetical protein IWZ03DRAFT_309418 [Phyllosticta citriasiana]|uniref:Zn(2)-C6 fungal-type domain-containing protein n=1 Tax=Phyllosticta citriasiana TaxID=595635 RepID=A0ABR1KQI4_9PEZI